MGGEEASEYWKEVNHEAFKQLSVWASGILTYPFQARGRQQKAHSDSWWQEARKGLCLQPMPMTSEHFLLSSGKSRLSRCLFQDLGQFLLKGQAGWLVRWIRPGFLVSLSPFSLSASIPTLEPAYWVNISLLALYACCCSSLPTVAALISAFGFVVQGYIWWLFKTQYSRNTGTIAGNEDIDTTYGLTLAKGTLRVGSLCIKVISIFSNVNLHLRTRDYLFF